jgi:hypothetical protein
MMTPLKQGESEAVRFKDASVTHEKQHTTGVAPRVGEGHEHHHGMIKVLAPRFPTLFSSPLIVHENVQPVVHKETIQPEVVHTTVPIREIRRAEAEHHGLLVLPMKRWRNSLQGGILTGGGQKAHETYEGEPKSYSQAMQIDRLMPMSTSRLRTACMIISALVKVPVEVPRHQAYTA